MLPRSELAKISAAEFAEACALLGGPGGLTPSQIAELSADHLAALGPHNLWIDQLAAWLRARLGGTIDYGRDIQMTVGKITPVQWARLSTVLTPQELRTVRSEWAAPRNTGAAPARIGCSCELACGLACRLAVKFEDAARSAGGCGRHPVA
jgi:hypothetical protein